MQPAGTCKLFTVTFTLHVMHAWWSAMHAVWSTMLMVHVFDFLDVS